MNGLLFTRSTTVALLAATAALICLDFVYAQPVQPEVLVSFNGSNGAIPEGGLTLGHDGNFYGTTYLGGSFGNGTVFQVTTNGVLTTLVSFTGANGATPVAGLMQGSDGNFYGTTSDVDGAGFYNSTVFQVTTNGVLSTLVSLGFAIPSALTRGSDGNLYGTTSDGGANSLGTVFQVTTNGVLTTLVYFVGVYGVNGANPCAGLTIGTDGNFYGTTEGGDGGSYLAGTVFQVTTNGILTTLAGFNGTNGAQPCAALTSGNDGNFYGTTVSGGIGYGLTINAGNGTVFRVTTNGLLSTLHEFGARTNAYGVSLDGSAPVAALTLGSDGNFYGTTGSGGFTNQYGVSLGTVFQVTTNGVLTTLFSFAETNGAGGSALTLGPDGDFYGTASLGGTANNGVIYRLRHGVSIQSFGMATNGFKLNTLNVGGSGWVVLESSSNLANWAPIQTNGTAAAQQFLDTTAMIQPRQFYRVRQQ